jgi:ferredoxin
MDGIMVMEGSGPGQGTPYRTEVLLGSTNPLALDIIAGTIAGYRPKDLPTNRIGLSRGIWLKKEQDINYNGPELKSLIRSDFKRIRVTLDTNISLKFIRNRIQFLRKLERRPVFDHDKCTGCRECIKICPQNAIIMEPGMVNHVTLTDRKCIRCFCCSEVCNHNAVTIRRKLVGI